MADVNTSGQTARALNAVRTSRFGNSRVAKPKFTEHQSRAKIREYQVIKTLCQLEQDGHRAMIKRLKLCENQVLQGYVTSKTSMYVREISKEIEWRKDQIKILEMDRIAAHNQIKYHSRRINESEVVCA